MYLPGQGGRAGVLARDIALGNGLDVEDTLDQRAALLCEPDS